LEFLSNVFAMFAGLPFVSFFVILVLLSFFLPKKKAVLTAIDITNVLLIISVSAMYYISFDSKMGIWWIVLFYLVVAGLIGGLQARMRGSVDFRRLLKAVWRLGFFVLSIVYLIYLITGIISNY
jgi:uncharacterized membrane protein YGL010W